MPHWPPCPSHRWSAAGAYRVTAGTYQKKPLFGSRERLNFLCETLLSLAADYQLQLEAWAVFPNHYHFMAISPARTADLRRWIGHLHARTAKEVNRLDGTPGRKVWFQYSDSRITYQKSYLARLNYMHSNAVKRELVRRPEQYEWCSAGWFQKTAERSFRETVMHVRSEGVRMEDDFVVSSGEIEWSETTSGKGLQRRQSGVEFRLRRNPRSGPPHSKEA